MAPSPGCWEERPKEAPAGSWEGKGLGLPRRNRGSLCERKALGGGGLPEEALWALSEPWSCPLRWLRPEVTSQGPWRLWGAGRGAEGTGTPLLTVFVPSPLPFFAPVF